MKIIKVGKNENIKTINEAIKAIDEPTEILLMDEYYKEKVVIDKNDIILNGQNKAVIDYDDYALKIHEDGREYVTFRTYTLIVKANNIVLKNLTIKNSAGEGHIVGQAVALHIYGDNVVVDNCSLLAHQDTLFIGPLSDDLIERYVDLLPENERFFKKIFDVSINSTYIEGTVDFIFGGGNALFNNCTIVSLPHNEDTFIVAPAHRSTVSEGFVFKDCKIMKHKDTKEDSVYLARPWRDYGIATFIDCYLDSHIKKEGFSKWLDTDRHAHARFSDINSYGPGASDLSKRVSRSKCKKRD